jgi:hypothetical protein
MDLNYLFFRQQVEKIRATTAESEEARLAHEQMARRYELIINEATADSFEIPVREAPRSVSPQR